MTSGPILETVRPKNDFGSHCYNDIFLQWPRFPLLQQCIPSLTPDHAGCLVPGNNATDRYRPIRCSSLTLELEGHLNIIQFGASYLLV
jgi:hypothetical protein